MEELDFLKQHWKQDDNFPKVDQSAIRNMLHKNSSSIVKWIFYISVIELLVGFCLNFLLPSEKNPESVAVYLEWVDYISSGIFYVFIAYFIYKFFSSYRNIKNTNSTSVLLATILETRKTVEHYIKFNLIYIGCVSVITSIALMFAKGRFSKGWGYALFYIIATTIIMFLVISFIIWLMKLYYKLVYRRLVKKLDNNYDELMKLDQDQFTTNDH